MNRTRGLTLSLGLAALTMVGLACGAGETQDPADAGPASDSPQAQGQPRPSGSAGEITSPIILGGAPLVSLTYEGAVYYQAPLGKEAANLNEDDLDLVGATTESNKLAPGGGESLKIYKLKDGEERYVYTVEPGRSFQNEDGNTITIEAEWIRWTAANSN